MVLFNYALKELTAKIVYYGPGLSGKTTNLQYIYEELPIKNKGRMLTLATETDRTLYFDFLPVDAGVVRGIKTRVQLYTVPGQVFYNATRRMVLKGADGVVFVADSQQSMMEANEESLENLRDNLQAHDLQLEEMPMVMQFNKRDLEDICTIEEMNDVINALNAPFYEAVAKDGVGVEDTLQAISSLVLKSVIDRYGGERAMNPMGQLEKTEQDVNPSDPDALVSAGASFGTPSDAAHASSDGSSTASGASSPPGTPPKLTRPAPSSPGRTPTPSPLAGASDFAGEPLDNLNIEGILDDALSLDEPEPEPSLLPTNPSPLPPQDGDSMFSGLLDDSFGVEKTESILGEGTTQQETFVEMPSPTSFQSSSGVKPLDNMEPEFGDADFTDADFGADALEPIGDVSGASLSELIKTKVSMPLSSMPSAKPKSTPGASQPAPAREPARAAPRGNPAPVSRAKPESPPSPAETPPSPAETPSRPAEAPSRPERLEVPVTVHLDGDADEQDIEVVLKIKFKRR